MMSNCGSEQKWARAYAEIHSIETVYMQFGFLTNTLFFIIPERLCALQQGRFVKRPVLCQKKRLFYSMQNQSMYLKDLGLSFFLVTNNHLVKVHYSDDFLSRRQFLFQMLSDLPFLRPGEANNTKVC
ncbi:hypothetical protein AVEN_173390-1 [Araneus ventricosus]|uniref:Uncharacterized protein n=1 Tax=Araneus ventricosus TaxID=182803 RepID=A0A4Y2G0C3_ARAVE|nr:hypothetical protein AVEN_173390-1 [Araneus ventricosus]